MMKSKHDSSEAEPTIAIETARLSSMGSSEEEVELLADEEELFDGAGTGTGIGTGCPIGAGTGTGAGIGEGNG